MTKFLDLDGLDYFWDKIVAKLNQKADIIHAVFGSNNIDDPDNQYLLMIGNGADSSHKNTAFSVDKDGNAAIDGGLSVGGNTAIDGNLSVDGNASVDGNLSVDGNGSFNDHVILQTDTVDSRIGSALPLSDVVFDGLTMYDSNGDICASDELVKTTTGDVYKRIGVKRFDQNGANPVENFLQFGVDDNGDPYVYVSDGYAWRKALDIGAQKSSTVTNISVATNTVTTIARIPDSDDENPNFQNGDRYLLIGHVVWPNNSTGFRTISFTDTLDQMADAGLGTVTCQAATGVQTRMQSVYWIIVDNLPTEQDFYLTAYHTAGTTLTISDVRIYAIRLR